MERLLPCLRCACETDRRGPHRHPRRSAPQQLRDDTWDHDLGDVDVLRRKREQAEPSLSVARHIIRVISRSSNLGLVAQVAVELHHARASGSAWPTRRCSLGWSRPWPTASCLRRPWRRCTRPSWPRARSKWMIWPPPRPWPAQDSVSLLWVPLEMGQPPSDTGCMNCSRCACCESTEKIAEQGHGLGSWGGGLEPFV